MKKCPKCGEESEEQFDACWKCGNRFDGAAAEEATPAPTIDQIIEDLVGPVPSPQPTLSVVSFVLALTGAGLGFLAIVTSKPGNGAIQLFPSNFGIAVIVWLSFGTAAVIVGCWALLRSSMKILAAIGIGLGLFMTIGLFT